MSIFDHYPDDLSDEEIVDGVVQGFIEVKCNIETGAGGETLPPDWDQYEARLTRSKAYLDKLDDRGVLDVIHHLREHGAYPATSKVAGYLIYERYFLMIERIAAPFFKSPSYYDTQDVPGAIYERLHRASSPKRSEKDQGSNENTSNSESDEAGGIPRPWDYLLNARKSPTPFYSYLTKTTVNWCIDNIYGDNQNHDQLFSIAGGDEESPNGQEAPENNLSTEDVLYGSDGTSEGQLIDKAIDAAERLGLLQTIIKKYATAFDDPEAAVCLLMLRGTVIHPKRIKKHYSDGDKGDSFEGKEGLPYEYCSQTLHDQFEEEVTAGTLKNRFGTLVERIKEDSEFIKNFSSA